MIFSLFQADLFDLYYEFHLVASFKTEWMPIRGNRSFIEAENAVVNYINRY
jgi:hypothetical protein